MLPEHEGIWRPFLGLAKSEIQEFAARQQIPHRHDESNDKLIYTRNRIRHLVIPEFDKLHRGSAGRIVEMAAEAKSLQDWCDAHFTATLPGGPRLDGAILAGLPRGVATHALAAFLRREGATSISRRLLHAVCARIDMRDAPPWQEELPGGGAVRVAKGQVTVLPYIKLQVSDKTSKK
jgi:tRNA(Ile)-lysidine synthase TilS/MesJ